MLRRSFFERLFGATAALELPEVKTAEILRLRTSDTIVVTLDGRASPEVLDRVSNMFKKNFPGQHVLIKDNSVDISIIRTEL